MGQSDFSANGSLSNYWPYILKKGTLNGNLNVSSKYLNVNVISPTTSGEPVNTTASKTFEVPDNLNLVIKADVDKMVFDKLNVTALNGKATVKDKKVILDALSLNLLNGKMLISENM